jgi:S1/P1 Nuclease
VSHVIKSLTALLVFAGAAAPALAWSKAGHMATGAVAYRVLKKDSPGTVPKVIAILKKHPYYLERWKDAVEDLDEDAADEYLFMLAARWADDAIGDDRFYTEGGHERLFHFINLPYKPPGQPDSVRTNDPAEINILRAFPAKLETFRSEADPAERAEAMCWVMHLTGDAHQPLHAVSLYTAKFQLKDHGRLVGERGGTWNFVRAKPGSAAESLHHFWDGLLTVKMKYRDNRNDVIAMMADPKHAPVELEAEAAVLDVEKWIRESHELAKAKAYHFDDTLIEGGTKAADAMILPTGYLAAVEPVAKRRGVLAGYRMAAVLRGVLGD